MVTRHVPTARHIVVAALVVLTLSSCTPETREPQQQPIPEPNRAAQPTPSDTSPGSSGATDSSSGRTSPESGAAEAGTQELPVDVGALVERHPITVRDGTVRPARADIEFGVGDTIELAVTSDVDGTLRAPRLDVSRDLPAGQETVVPITVTRAGTFEVTFQGVLVAVLTVS